MLFDNFDATPRHGRIVASWQRGLLAVVLVLVLAALLATGLHNPDWAPIFDQPALFDPANMTNFTA